VQEGELTARGSSGVLDDGSSPTERTVYRIASMTKSFSAATTLLLRDEGVLRLDDPLGSYAPELAGLRSPTDDAPEIRVRDLLCMTSGLVTDDAWADRHLDLTDDEFDRLIEDGLVFAEPTGNAFEYSNFGFALLGRVVHRATGRRLQAITSDRILRPLGMDDTTWVRPGHDAWARPKRWSDDGWADEVNTPGDGLIAPMGGIWSTVADLAIWVAWLADAFPARDDADGDEDDGPLQRASRREMQTPQRYVGMRTLRGVRMATSYGFGLRLLDEPEHGFVVTHSGGFPGYGSNMRWTPGGDVGVIALANVTYAPMTELAARIHDQVAVLPASATPRRGATDLDRIAHRLVDVLDRWGRVEPIAADELDGLFADNVGPDDAFDRRARSALAHGGLTLDEVVAINDARAQAVCTSSRGSRVTVTFALAPTRPLRVQEYELAGEDGGDSGDGP
jgi:CubicO group peptidase (beta-lactamase class C family)